MVGEIKRGDKIVIATHNKGKAKELEELFATVGVETVSAGELGLAEPEETGESFAENATIKAEAAAKASGLPAVSDDSGLEVTALGGAPGIHSARWAGADKDFARSMQLVEEKLRAAAATAPEARAACFVAVLSLAFPDGTSEEFRGEVEGTVVWPPRGDRGFGYDPIFLPHGHSLTFGEMEPAAKHRISHRANAFRQLVAACFVASFEPAAGQIARSRA